jgi:cell division septal protein FtsQ
LSAEIFTHIRNFTEVLKANGFEINALLIPDETDINLYLNNNVRVYFSQADTPDNLKEKLTSLLNADPLKSIDPEKIDYIDVRFGNKAYYKLKE